MKQQLLGVSLSIHIPGNEMKKIATVLICNGIEYLGFIRTDTQMDFDSAACTQTNEINFYPACRDNMISAGWGRR